MFVANTNYECNLGMFTYQLSHLISMKEMKKKNDLKHNV